MGVPLTTDRSAAGLDVISAQSGQARRRTAPGAGGDPLAPVHDLRSQFGVWSATKEATQARAEFQLMVSSFVDQDWMSSR